MSRLKNFGRDAAYYFGIGEGSERTRQSTNEQERPLVSTAVGVAAALVVAFLLRQALGLDEDVAGCGLSLALAFALALVCALALRLGRRERGHPRPPRNDA
jgi:hypothetical protein